MYGRSEEISFGNNYNPVGRKICLWDFWRIFYRSRSCTHSLAHYLTSPKQWRGSMKFKALIFHQWRQSAWAETGSIDPRTFPQNINLVEGRGGWVNTRSRITVFLSYFLTVEPSGQKMLTTCYAYGETALSGPGGWCRPLFSVIRSSWDWLGLRHKL